VTKINKRGKAQERLLCIDGFNIHNRELNKSLKTTNENGSFWGSL